jgi:hypothetical protein
MSKDPGPLAFAVAGLVAGRASAMPLRARRPEVLADMAASLRADSG